MRSTAPPVRMLVLVLAALALVVPSLGTGASAGRAWQGDTETTELFVTFLRDGKVASARRSLDVENMQVGTAALEELLAGPSEAEREAGLTTAIPEGTELLGLTIDQEAKVATVDFSAEFTAPPEVEATPAPGVEPVAARTRLAQVVYTLTQFPTVETVRFDVEGQPLETFDLDGDGGEAATDLSEPVGRLDFEDVTPLIYVESPVVGDEIASPVQVVGTANTFEATFFVQVRDEDGNVLVEQLVTASSGSGVRGTFEIEVSFEVEAPGPGMLVVFERSPRDGAEEGVVEIPVVLRS